MKRFSLFFLASLLLSGIILLPLAFSQTNETLTISTYYPSPYGVYNELRLYPKSAPLASPCSALYEGTMYYDKDTHELMVCNGIGGWGWKSMSLWTLNATDLYPTNTTWNVGIGTTSPPLGKLHIYDLIGPTRMGNVWFGGSNPAYGDMQFDGASDGIFVFTNTGIASGGTAFYSSATGKIPLVMANTGNVGIGLGAGATPGAKLEVAGQVKITDGSQGVGKVLTSDAFGLASWQAGGGAPAISGELQCDLPKGGGSTKTCQISTTDDVCFLTRVFAADPGKDVNGFECKIRQSGSTWYLDVYQDGNTVYCAARCINF